MTRHLIDIVAERRHLAYELAKSRKRRSTAILLSYR